LAPNYLLITLIRVSITQGVIVFPLKRNLIPRFTKGRGKHRKTMKDALIVEIRECRNSREGDLHGFPYSFSFCAWTIKHLIESDGASQLCVCRTSSFDLLGSTTRVEAQKEKNVLISQG
jgi:hypothetical protein